MWYEVQLNIFVHIQIIKLSQNISAVVCCVKHDYYFGHFSVFGVVMNNVHNKSCLQNYMFITFHDQSHKTLKTVHDVS